MTHGTILIMSNYFCNSIRHLSYGSDKNHLRKEGFFLLQFEFSPLQQGKVYGGGRSKQLVTVLHSQLRSRDR